MDCGEHLPPGGVRHIRFFRTCQAHRSCRHAVQDRGLCRGAEPHSSCRRSRPPRAGRSAGHARILFGHLSLLRHPASLHDLHDSGLHDPLYAADPMAGRHQCGGGLRLLRRRHSTDKLADLLEECHPPRRCHYPLLARQPADTLHLRIRPMAHLAVFHHLFRLPGITVHLRRTCH